MTHTLFMGKAPARPGAVKVSFEAHVDTVKLPEPPKDFGHEKLEVDWNVLCNDLVGCCAISGSEHETMLWCAEAERPVSFVLANAPITAQPTIKNYSDVTGYVPGAELTNPGGGYENPTDQGTDVASLIKYRYLKGLYDAAGNTHKIDGAAALRPGDFEQLWYAAYYFDGVGIGIKMCQEWMDAFERGHRVWDKVHNPTWIGGHYISAVAWRNGRPVVITWGEPVEITRAGYEMASDEAYAYVSAEKIGVKGTDLQGLNLRQMMANMPLLRDVS